MKDIPNRKAHQTGDNGSGIFKQVVGYCSLQMLKQPAEGDHKDPRK